MEKEEKDKQEEKDEQEEKENKENFELEKEHDKKQKHKGLIILVIVILLVIFAGIGYTVYYKTRSKVDNTQKNSSDNNKNNSSDSNDKNNNGDTSKNEDNQKGVKAKPIIAFGSWKRVGLLDENLNLIWHYDVDGFIRYGDIALDGNYVYFTVTNDNSDAKLYRVNIKKLEVEDLNIQFNYPWNIYTAGNNQLLYMSLHEYHIVNLDSKEDTLLEIEGNNNTALVNDNLVYTKNASNGLYVYNLTTKEDKKIEDDARIVQISNNYVVYVTNSEQKYYLYDIVNNKKTYLYQAESYNTIILNDKKMEKCVTTLYNNTIYMVAGNVLYTLKNNKLNKIYEFSLNDNESIEDIKIISLEKNKFFITKFIDDGKGCTGEGTCGPSGESKYIILNTDTKKEVEVSDDDLHDSSEIAYLNK